MLLEPDLRMTGGASGSCGEGVVVDEGAAIDDGGDGDGAPAWLDGEERAWTNRICAPGCDRRTDPCADERTDKVIF